MRKTKGEEFNFLEPNNQMKMKEEGRWVQMEGTMRQPVPAALLLHASMDGKCAKYIVSSFDIWSKEWFKMCSSFEERASKLQRLGSALRSLAEKGRKVPYAIYANKKYRINNLHIHSKRLELFLSAQEAKLKEWRISEGYCYYYFWFNFAFAKTLQVKIRVLSWMNNGDLDAMQEHL